MEQKIATLYRMVTEKHICPFGIKSKALLQEEGYHVDGHYLTTKDDIEQFKEKHHVETTPQTFILDKRIGGYDDLLKFFSKKTLKQEGVSYQPIIAIFGVSLLMALSIGYAIHHNFLLFSFVELFIAISMCILAIMKLRDLYSFSNQFITYDVLGQSYIKYAYIYPFVELFSGLCMISNVFMGLAAPAMLFIGVIGSYSVYKAVYIEKRELKCACVGGNSTVPLGAISLTENLMMVFMGLRYLF